VTAPAADAGWRQRAAQACRHWEEHGAPRVRRARQAGQVQHAAGAVADVGQHDRRHVAAALVQRGRDAGRAVHEAHAVPPAQQPRQAVQHVHVRAKVGALCAPARAGFG